MLQAGSSKTVSFNVNVMGTSATPQTVRVILGTTPELSYVARQVGEGWQADIEVPEGAPDSVDLRVEVVINNRLFTPIHKRVSILKHVAPEPAVSPEPAGMAHSSLPDYEELEDIVVPDAVHETPAVPNVKPIEPEKKFEPIPPVNKVLPKVSILKQFAAEETKKQGVVSDVEIALDKLAETSTKPVKKTWPTLTTGFPAKSKVTEKIVVNIADINSIASKNFDQALSESKSYVSPIKPIKKVARKVESLVKLVKGDIIYE